MAINIDSDPRLQTVNAVSGSARASGYPPNESAIVNISAQSENTRTTKASTSLSDTKASPTPLSKDAQDEKDKLMQEKLEGVVTDLNSSIQGVQRNLAFSVDDDSGEIVISVTDKQSGELLRQIPSEDALELAKKLQELSASGGDKAAGSAEGLLVKTSA